MISSNHIKLCAILEPIVSESNIRELNYFCGRNNWLSNQDVGGQIWLLWKADILVSLVSKSNQAITVDVQVGGTQICVSAIYAKYHYLSRRELWSELCLLQSNVRIPWIWGGDFNTVRFREERQGGKAPRAIAMTEFNDCIEVCEMMPVPTAGSRFTWCNNMQGNRRQWQVLDRILQSTGSANLGRLSASVQHREHSDHAPIACSWKLEEYSGPRLWRFLRAWTLGAGFKETVDASWRIQHGGSCLRELQCKLKHCKRNLKFWNSQSFGNIFRRKDELELLVRSTEEDLIGHWNSDLFDQFSSLKQEWREVLLQEEVYWKQKSRNQWIREGDANTKYFHALVRSRIAMSHVDTLLDDDNNLIRGPEAIHLAAIDYYSSLFTSEPHTLDYRLLDLVPLLVTDEDNAALLLPFARREVLEAVKSIPVDSAAGNDGFSSSFFISCWDIVGDSVVSAVNEFLVSGHLPRYFTHTVITLIPKKNQPVSLSGFRPISLCTTIYKIVAKLLGRRLSCLLPKLITKNQSAFVQGRSIFDNIALAQEITREIGKRGKGSNVMFSLDMLKAYDRLEWDFLLAVLRKFGFAERWVVLIQACISSCSYSVVFQGIVKGYFIPSRGLRQGDPLSPSLFILAQDVLSRALIHGIKKEELFVTTRAACPSHLMFADDIVIFANAKRKSIVNFMTVLDQYQRCSGQKLQLEKCKFFLPTSAPRERVRVVRDTTLFSRGTFPLIYLGVPVGPGKCLTSHFQTLIDRVQAKAQGWQANLLSEGGRLILIRHVLASMPIHMLAVANIPATVLSKIESIVANFFWGRSEWGKRKHWAAWKSLCLPVAEGGIGVRALVDVKKAFHLKLCWLLSTSDSMWAEFMRCKYRIHKSPSFWSGPQRGSVLWKSLRQYKGLFSNLCGWNIGKGDVSFWFDNWSPEFRFDFLAPDRESTVKLRDFYSEDGWNFEEIEDIIGPELVQLASDIAPTISENDDDIFWIPERHRSFSLKSAWEEIRHKGHHNFVLSSAWATKAPVHSKLIVLKVIKDILPVDLKVKRHGFHLASKCVCCSSPAEESLVHLFNEGDLAISLWKYFGSIFAVPFLEVQSSYARMAWWFRRCKGSSHFSTLGRAAAVVILRQIWSFRNNAVHGGSRRSLVAARLTVIEVLQHIEGLIQPRMKNSRFGVDSLQMLGIMPREPRRTITVVLAPGAAGLDAVGRNDRVTADGGVLSQPLGSGVQPQGLSVFGSALPPSSVFHSVLDGRQAWVNQGARQHVQSLAGCGNSGGFIPAVGIG
jgi:hypothetical protein